MEHVALSENYQSPRQGPWVLSNKPRASGTKALGTSGYARFSREAASELNEKRKETAESVLRRLDVSLPKGRLRLHRSGCVQSSTGQSRTGQSSTGQLNTGQLDLSDYSSTSQPLRRCNTPETEKSRYQERTQLRIVRKNSALSQGGVCSGTRATFRLRSPIRGADSVAFASMPTVLVTPDVAAREALGEYVEHLFNEVRGEALLIAALAYGLEVTLDDLRTVQIRDVRLSDGVVILGGCERDLPSALREDMQEQMRRYSIRGEDMPRGRNLDRLFFSSDAFSQIEKTLSNLESCYQGRFRRFGGSNEERYFNVRLKVLGWFHKRWASRVAGVYYQSALDLFDKGPRINRRRGGGMQDIYYVWRLSRVVSW